MLEFLQRFFGRDNVKSASKQTAKERLRLVLVHDRASISPKTLESLKEDLIKVISEYMEIDKNGLEVSFAKEDDSIALVCNIPIVQMKRNLKTTEMAT
ncbi:MAG TPA: cell division topological specificity factor MinE [Clostridia bacterium]|nr:cell division topological specificity factor MinE [Clostridia bacterium]